MKELLEAGVHFWSPDAPLEPEDEGIYFRERNGIHIIDLQKTLKMFREASRFVSEISSHGRTVLFVGTKRQRRKPWRKKPRNAAHFFWNHRWLGGTLTNWATCKNPSSG